MALHSPPLFGLAAAVTVLLACGGPVVPPGTQLISEPDIDYRLRIVRECSWSVLIDNSALIHGSGRATLDVPDHDTVCAVVSKTEERGRLRSRISPAGLWDETREAHGTITVCNAKERIELWTG